KRFVDEGSLPAERFELLSNLGTEESADLPLPLASSNGHGIEQGTAARRVEQSGQFVLSHRSTLAAAVCLLIGLDDAFAGIGHHPAGLDSPVAKRGKRDLVCIA